jgi:hypothetical protein
MRGGSTHRTHGQRERSRHRVTATGVLMVVALMLQGMPAAAVDEIPAPVVWIDPSDAWVTTSWVSASWAIDGEADVAGWALTVDQEPASDPGPS